MKFEYPSLTRRYFSTLIDSLFVIGMVILWPYLLDYSNEPATTIRVAIILFMFFIYEPFFTAFFCTLGQRITGVRIRSFSTGTKITIIRAYLRIIVKLILGVISFFTIPFTKHKRAIHDFAVGSLVIYEGQKTWEFGGLGGGGSNMESPENDSARTLDQQNREGPLTRPIVEVFPKPVARAIARHHKGGVTPDDCVACSSGCCSQGGFAILENVLLAYERYRTGGLDRAHWQFASGLSFSAFVFRHFDVWTHDSDDGRDQLVCFHMRNVGPTGELVAIPEVGHYWETRVKLFAGNPWLNRGCLFLNTPVSNWPDDDGDATRQCILHEPFSSTHVTAKPIDCVHYTCKRPYEPRMMSVKQSEKWFQALIRAFPGSRTRFESLLDSETDDTFQQGDAPDEDHKERTG